MEQESDPFKEFEFPENTQEAPPKLKPLNSLAKKINSLAKRVSPTLAIISLALAGAGVYFGYPVYKNYLHTKPANDGYVAPRSPGDIVAKVLEGTVTINCRTNEGVYSLGSGWSIDLEPSSSKYKSSIITNYHVIDDCADGKGTLSVEDYDGKVYEVNIDVYDKKNDLAKLSTTLKVAPLELSANAPWTGYWVMTAGTADGYQGSISFGAIMNTYDNEIFITANTSHGNSGGPLVDNEGYVIGTNSWGREGEQYNGAMSLDAMCLKILECEYNNGKEFWDYS